MGKLLAKYAAKPTTENALRVAKYARQHPFASLMLTTQEAETLRAVYEHIREYFERHTMGGR